MKQDDDAANELDAFLTARRAGHTAPAPQHFSPEEAALADELLRLAEAIQLDPAVASNQKAQLQARAARSAAHPGAGLRAWKPAHTVIGQRWRAWAVAALLVLAALLAVPPVRASLLAVLRLGAVRILLAVPTPSAAAPTSPAQGTPLPSATPLASVLDLAGETTLAAAQQQLGFPIRLPSYPADLGPPDRVFLQDLSGPAVVLVWLDAAHPNQVRLSLHQLGPGYDVSKQRPPIVQAATVHGQAALWTEGPYPLEVRPSNQTNHYLADRRLVTGHVLIWQEGAITYRLETDRSLDEAVRIAESLR